MIFLKPFTDNHEGQSSIPVVGPISYVHGDGTGTNVGTCITESESLASWEEILEQYTMGNKSAPSNLSMSSIQSNPTGIGRNEIFSETLTSGIAAKDEHGGSLLMESHWQVFNFVIIGRRKREFCGIIA